MKFYLLILLSDFFRVALFTRAWIEIYNADGDFYTQLSPSSRGRGLKSVPEDYTMNQLGRPLHEGVD